MTDSPRPAGFLRGPAGSPGGPRQERSGRKVASGGSPALHWGKIFENPCATRRCASSARKRHQRTQSEQTDASGMVYMQARYYLPAWGRFASPDPAMDQHLDQSQSWNLYSYVQNNPVMKVDPTGMAADWYMSPEDRKALKLLPPPPPPKPAPVPAPTHVVKETHSRVGVERTETRTATVGNTSSKTTTTTGNSADNASITLRGNSGFETATTTETKHGAFSSVTTESHKEGILSGAGGVDQNGLSLGGSATAIEHGFTWTGKITVGDFTLNLPGVGVSYGIGAGAKAEFGVGDSGRIGLSTKASVGETLGVTYLPPTVSWKW